MKTPKSVDDYIQAAAPQARPMLRQLRSIVRTTAPRAVEGVSYGMPYYSYCGRLTYFAAFKKHVSVFAWGAAMKEFAAEVKPYRTSTGTLQFPLGSRLPVTLLRRLLKARVKDNEAKQAGSGRGRASRSVRATRARSGSNSARSSSRRAG